MPESLADHSEVPRHPVENEAQLPPPGFLGHYTLRESIRSLGTLKGFLNVMDRFRNLVQVSGSAGRVGQTLSQGSTLDHNVQSEMRSLFLQISVIELTYGVLGFMVLSGLFLFAKCSGRAERAGWIPVVHDLLGGNNLLHFLAQLVALLNGVLGLVSIYQNDGKNDLVFIVPILVGLSNLLVGAANGKKITANAEVNTNVAPSAFSYQPDLRSPRHAVVQIPDDVPEHPVSALQNDIAGSAATNNAPFDQGDAAVVL